MSHLKEVLDFLSKEIIAVEDVTKLVTNIREAMDTTCLVCTPPRMPIKDFLNLSWVPDPMPMTTNPDKFQHFEDLYRKETQEVYRPTYVENLDEPNRALLVVEKVRTTIRCVSCYKPRVVYADKKLWTSELVPITNHIEVILFYVTQSV